MSLTIEILESEIMQLPLAQRTSLIDRLMQSISSDPHWEAAVDKEAARRESEYEQGSLPTLSREQSMQRMLARVST